MSYSLYSMGPYFQTLPWLMALLLVWTIPWKGVALWKAARNNQSAWFVVLLIINTVGILEIFYIFLFSKKPTKRSK